MSILITAKGLVISLMTFFHTKNFSLFGFYKHKHLRNFQSYIVFYRKFLLFTWIKDYIEKENVRSVTGSKKIDRW